MPWKRIRILAGRLLEAAAAAAALGTLLACGGRWGWVFELFTHFRAHYLLVLFAALIYTAFFQRWRLTGLLAAFAAINLAVIVPDFCPRSAQADGPAVRLMLANVHVHNREHDRLLHLVRQESPDVLIVLEVDRQWQNALDALRSEYPHRISRPRSDSFGIALLSRLPPSRLELREIGPAEVPSIVAELDCGDGGLLNLVATHPLPPIGPEYSHLRNDQLEAVGSLLVQLPQPKVLVGDLNTTPWSPYFQDLLGATGMCDSRRGFGLQPTWPGQIAMLGIPIDHVLVSPDVSVSSRAVGPDIGSDHRPVVVDLVVSDDHSENRTTE
jgi:endonuclease/exonuclease/phosphatase (EEP) superfamily protein YafD